MDRIHMQLVHPCLILIIYFCEIDKKVKFCMIGCKNKLSHLLIIPNCSDQIKIFLTIIRLFVADNKNPAGFLS